MEVIFFVSLSHDSSFRILQISKKSSNWKMRTKLVLTIRLPHFFPDSLSLFKHATAVLLSHRSSTLLKFARQYFPQKGTAKKGRYTIV